jgi:hypothetical protein
MTDEIHSQALRVMRRVERALGIQAELVPWSRSSRIAKDLAGGSLISATERAAQRADGPDLIEHHLSMMVVFSPLKPGLIAATRNLVGLRWTLHAMNHVPDYARRSGLEDKIEQVSAQIQNQITAVEEIADQDLSAEPVKTYLEIDARKLDALAVSILRAQNALVALRYKQRTAAGEGIDDGEYLLAFSNAARELADGIDESNS